MKKFREFLEEAARKTDLKPGDRVIVRDPASVSHNRVGEYVGPKGRKHEVKFSNGAKTSHALTKLEPKPGKD